MKKIIAILIIILMLLPTSAKILDLKAEQLDAYGVAGLMTILPVEEKPKSPDDKDHQECKCKNGKISYDGGTSWSDCPCVTKTGKCNCNHSVKDEPVKQKTEPDLKEIDRVVLITQPRVCVPCRMFESVVAILKNENHQKSGWKIGNKRSDNLQILDLDNEEDVLEVDNLNLSFSAIPYFIKLKNGKVVNTRSGKLSYDEFIRFSGATISKKKVTPFYIKQTYLPWTLNGQLTPKRDVLIKHLRLDHGLDWPFDSLSYDELISIHNDDHNGKLGKCQYQY